MGNFNQAPILKSKGEKNRENGLKYAVRTHYLEMALFNIFTGKEGAQLKLILFLTGNSDKGNFAVPEATVMKRCGMSETTYKNARKKLVEKGLIIHNPSTNGQQGEIIVDYDAIYKCAKEIIDNTSVSDIDDTPSKSDNTPSGDIEYTYNNTGNTINPNNQNPNIISQRKPEVKNDFIDENGNFIF